MFDRQFNINYKTEIFMKKTTVEETMERHYEEGHQLLEELFNAEQSEEEDFLREEKRFILWNHKAKKLIWEYSPEKERKFYLDKKYEGFSREEIRMPMNFKELTEVLQMRTMAFRDIKFAISRI